MVRLDDIFASVSPTVEQTLSTTGSTIATYDSVLGEPDPVTLEQDETDVTVGTPIAVYLTDYSLTEGQPLPGVEVVLGDWKILAPGEVTLDERQRIECLSSRDSRYPGRRATVLGSKKGGHGLMTVIYARPEAPEAP